MRALFTIGFAALIRWHTARKYFTSQWKEMMQSYLQGVAVIKEELLSFRSDKEWLLQFNGTKLYMEHYLNDLFDPTIRGIYIERAPFISTVYRYNREENRTRYKYNRWSGAIAYSTGEYARFGAKVYVAIDDSTGEQPDGSPAYWEEHADATYLYNKEERSSATNYFVVLPAHMNLTESLRLKIRGAVDVFNLASAKYQIKKES